MYDLDADINHDTKHTSNKQDAIMVKQREQRCGKVIWTTILQLFYMFLYLYLIIDRYNIGQMYSMNLDLKEIMLNTPFYHGSEDSSIKIKTHILNHPTEDGFFEWVSNIEQEQFISSTVELFDDGEFSKQAFKADVFFIHEKSNYIVFQGVTICAKLYLQSFKDGNMVHT